MPTASMKRQPFRDARGQGVIVFDPARVRQAVPGLFEATTYGADAQPVQGQGGRGAAWFVRGEFGEGVLRHYRRGGWMAKVSTDAYLWLGEKHVRSLREFELLRALNAASLPVPVPLAAFFRRRGLACRAAILIERIAQARPFAEIVRLQAAQAPWAAVGAAIARCHRQRAHHADLNANNILVGPQQKAWLIDWDKGCIEPDVGGWCGSVLDRLRRSLRKECPGLAESELDAGMRKLRAAHDIELRP